MAKAKKPAKEASATFHNIMKASVTPDPLKVCISQYSHFLNRSLIALKKLSDSKEPEKELDLIDQIKSARAETDIMASHFERIISKAK
jgi:hypothetical protein